MPSVIDISAQFGGRDAAKAVLPHFKLLKSAANNIQLDGFPLPKLAFILRVDGEVTSYGQSGAGHLEVDKAGEYLSVDIGIQPEDRESVVEVVAAAILSSPKMIESTLQNVGSEVDTDALEVCLKSLCDSYRDSV